jgi:hypothetical protein
MRNTADVAGGKPIAVLLQSISGLSAINPLVAVYDIHGGKREVLFFYFVPDTTRDCEMCDLMCVTMRLNQRPTADDTTDEAWLRSRRCSRNNHLIS